MAELVWLAGRTANARAGLTKIVIHLLVNGVSCAVDEGPDFPLIWALRDALGLRATQYNCLMGVCNTCMVLLGSDAINACITSIGSVAGQPITTIEGLALEGTALIPAQTGWSLDTCRYCQAAQVMTTTADLLHTPGLSVEIVEAALVNPVCRCGTYPRIRAAILKRALR